MAGALAEMLATRESLPAAFAALEFLKLAIPLECTLCERPHCIVAVFLPQKHFTLVAWILHGGQGPGWQGSAHACRHVCARPHVSPHECGNWYWSQSGSLILPQKQ